MSYKNIVLSMFVMALFSYIPLTIAMELPEQQLQEKKRKLDNLLFFECKKEEPIANNILFFIQQGADVNAQDIAFGATPLMYVCETGKFNIAKLLIENGADLNIKNKHGNAALHFACQFQRMSIVKLLLDSGANVDIQNTSMTAPLHIVCEIGSMDFVDILIGYGANKNIQNDEDRTPLHIACEYKKERVVEFLIKRGADVNILAVNGISPLHVACEYGLLSIVRLLVENGANINAKRSDNEVTPLIIACNFDYVAIITYLISKRADVNAAMITGATPLHFAAWKNNIGVCKFLLKSHADINAKTEDGTTPLDYALENGDIRIINLFKQYGAIVISQEQADKNMRAFFTELNEEKAQKERKFQERKKKQQAKKVESKEHEVLSKKEIERRRKLAAAAMQSRPESAVSSGAQEISINKPVEHITEASPISMSGPVVTSSQAKPYIIASPSAQSESIIKEQDVFEIKEPIKKGDVYLVLQDAKLKWPRSLSGNQLNMMKDQLKQLKNWPHHGLDIKKLAGKSNMFRLRVGSYRVVFSVDEKRREIKIHEIGLRKSIYKNLKI